LTPIKRDKRDEEITQAMENYEKMMAEMGERYRKEQKTWREVIGDR